jgi:uncharacterized integral membrane protein
VTFSGAWWTSWSDRAFAPEKEFVVMRSSPYRGRRPSLVRRFWIYRRLVALAFVLGVMLWFIWANDATIQVAFPFGLGVWPSTTGVVILLSALAGSVLTALGFTVVLAVRRIRSPLVKGDDEPAVPPDDDLPPADYAARTGEGFPESRWS